MPEVGQWGPEPFLSRLGRPVLDAVVTVYEVDGTTLATLYTTQAGDTELANPLPTGVATTVAGLDVRGNGTFYAEPGPYVLAVDRDGDEVYRGPITIAVDADEMYVVSEDIRQIVSLSQAVYDTLSPPDPAILYLITT